MLFEKHLLGFLVSPVKDFPHNTEFRLNISDASDEIT